ncbi:MAG TPA: hypothetical protein VKQ30_02505 [Ktedonobacterales bacterium]|nr:hypothetical protein [Ktedonobacterales bacterium]
MGNDEREVGEMGGAARLNIETRIGHPVVSPLSHNQLRHERQRELQPPLMDMPEGQH